MDGINYLMNLAPWKGWGNWGIDNIGALMRALGDPQDKIKTFHVAGTNGKGSVSVALSAILGASGGRVVLNSSPHLVRINERIVIDGSPISDELLDSLLLSVRDAASRSGVTPSLFEAITAAAFLCGSEVGTDYGVYEVGLGGRIDATNVIARPLATAVVTIDFDHEKLLGDTIRKIAGEKAGIAKPNVPLIMGKMAEEAQWEIAEKASAIGAPVCMYGRDFWTEEVVPSRIYRFVSPKFGNFEFQPSLPGEHQVHNMAVAIAMARTAGIPIPSCADGVKEVYWPARLELCRYHDLEIIIDSAHNPAGVASLISFLNSNNLSELELVFGALRTKRWQEMVDSLRPYVKRWNVLTPDFAEAVPSVEIEGYLSGIGVSARSYDDNYLKLLSDLRSERHSRPIVVAGSMYMVGKLKAEMGIPIPQLWKRGE